jgi:hypothetical protein
MSEAPMTPAAAMMRLNELDRIYPRVPSRNPRSETVLENDAEWLARNPQVNADEWRKLWRIAKGVAA